jgi:hypothetical protein
LAATGLNYSVSRSPENPAKLRRITAHPFTAHPFIDGKKYATNGVSVEPGIIDTNVLVYARLTAILPFATEAPNAPRRGHPDRTGGGTS